MDKNELRRELLNQAHQAMENAYVPYSKFPVGAAVYANGETYQGGNIENASYGLTNCAERTAKLSAVSEGHAKLEAIAVCADTDGPVSPCGACRQVMTESFAPETKVYLTDVSGDLVEYTLAELLPRAFQATHVDP